MAVLQILGNLPITRQNVTSLMHGSISGASQADAISKAVEDLINDPIVPFGEQDGNLCFYSEKLNDIEQERSQVALRGVELRRIVNEALTSVYAPLPATQLHGSYAVSTGLKAQSAGNVATKGKHRFIDKVHVRYVEKEKRHWASLESFNSQRIAIGEKFYRDNDRLLEGGIWAEVTLSHNAIEEDDYAFYIEDLRPIQISRFDFDRYCEGRNQFTRDEWIAVILRTVAGGCGA